ncbi:MAG: bleomycin resistance protein [Gemmataceae bacterium]
MVEPIGLVPFVPSGSGFAKSRHLFRTLGFEELWANDGFAGFQYGPAKFILQNMDEPAFAGNYTLKIEVSDLDAWWVEVQQKKLDQQFPGFGMKPPTDYPWGREVHFVDFAGVCWHVGQP